MRLALKGIEKTFAAGDRAVAAVRGVDLAVDDGEFFVLLGPSGCGKSTLLNLVAGLERPDAGEIWFDDELAAAPARGIFRAPRERNVAMVFQSYALYPHLTVFENIAFPLRMGGERPERLRPVVEEAAAGMGLSGRLQAKPAELSGGQRQRVAIARAIVRRPRLFLLDEPLSNLDARLRASTRRELKDLQRRLGVTTLYVTHDQVEAMTLGDRIALLREGRIEQAGSPQDLYDRPTSPFVGTFLGSPPMNLFSGTISHAGDETVLEVAGIRTALRGEAAAALRRHPAGPRVFGIRPEDLRIGPGAADIRWRARVLGSESLGRERLVRVALDGRDLTLISGERAPSESETVEVGFTLDRLHVFPPGAGAII